jgi:hypothetical protein
MKKNNFIIKTKDQNQLSNSHVLNNSQSNKNVLANIILIIVLFIKIISQDLISCEQLR